MIDKLKDISWPEVVLFCFLAGCFVALVVFAPMAKLEALVAPGGVVMMGITLFLTIFKSTKEAKKEAKRRASLPPPSGEETKP